MRFDGSLSEDPDGGVASWQWDFGDGATGAGEDVEHTYTAGGRYFPALTVTDNQGAESTFVEEIAVGLPTAPSAWTGGSDGATAHGAVDPENQPTSWYFEYGPTSQYGAVSPTSTLPAPEALHQVQAQLPRLVAGRPYHYRLVATNASGTTEGEDRLLVAGSGPPLPTAIATPCSPLPSSPPTGASASSPATAGRMRSRAAPPECSAAATSAAGPARSGRSPTPRPDSTG